MIPNIGSIEFVVIVIRISTSSNADVFYTEEKLQACICFVIKWVSKKGIDQPCSSSTVELGSSTESNLCEVVGLKIDKN